MGQLDGAAVRTWAVAAAEALARSAARIDAVNVFPVPDADTGTNVRLTVAGGAAAATATPQDADAAQVARAFALGSLRSARGNSGVIVSQYLEGFAAALIPRTGVGTVARPEPDAAVLAGALVRAADESARAVARPEEGTVLTVARQVGEQARRAALRGAALGEVLGPALVDARHQLRTVSARNPVLRSAAVVDAGACALLVVLDALDRTLSATDGRPLTVESLDWLPSEGPDPQPGPPGTRPPQLEGGTFEVMLLVRPARPDDELGDRLRAALSEVGDSVAVVGADDLWHLHVHTDDPAAAISAAAPAGIREQVEVRLVEGAAAQVAAGDDLGVVIGTSSPGTAAWFATGGAVVVVQCPEAAVEPGHLVRAAIDTGCDHVVVLPGTPEVARAAHAAAGPTGVELPGVEVDVVDEAVGVLPTAVASLAVLGGRPGEHSARADRARAALGRLRTRDLGAAQGLDELLEAVDTVVAAAGAVQAVTVQHADPVPDAAALLAALARHHPELDAVLVGPVGCGPAWRIGVD